MQDKLRDDLKQSLKAGDKDRAGVLRLVLAAIKNAEISNRGPIGDAATQAVIAKEAKQRRESIEVFRKGDRQDLVSKEEAELTILLEYLPEQMSREEIIIAAKQAIEEMGARGLAEKGKIMSRLMKELKGKAGGQDVSDVVTELLAGLPQ